MKMSRRGLFERTKFIMMLAGIWKLEGTNLSTFAIKLYEIYSIGIQARYIITPFLLIINVPTLIRKDLNAAMDTISKIIFSSIVAIKARICQEKKIVNLISEALKEDECICVYKKSVRLKIYEQHMSLCSKLTLFLMVSVSTAGGYLLISGYVAIFDFYYSPNHLNSTMERPVMLHFWYPFDINHHCLWTIADETMAILYTVICSSAVNTFINSTMIFLRAQLIMLQNNFRNFDDLSQGNSPGSNLRRLCRRHQNIIQYVDSFNESLRFVMLLEFSVASVMLAASLFQIFAGKDVVFSCIYVLMCSGQIIVLAWSSDEILTQSLELGTALYESKWFDQTKRVIAVIQIMLLRCQKPLTLSVGPFGPLTVDVAASRFKLAYTYTTVMTGTLSE
ncbi:odorant receptor 67c-like [Cylas formicarius]|uniref:odorant receptor 67c-like n=1 Tax=Cylas formicarius TaxID=197179 RepID=UPI0029584C15|nr:odorant receptor 67c-like [Cylas formicarius]